MVQFLHAFLHIVFKQNFERFQKRLRDHGIEGEVLQLLQASRDTGEQDRDGVVDSLGAESTIVGSSAECSRAGTQENLLPGGSHERITESTSPASNLSVAGKMVDSCAALSDSVISLVIKIL